MTLPKHTLVLALTMLLGTATAFSTAAQQNHANADDAAAALVSALESKPANADQLARLLGSDWQDYIPIGGIDRDDVEAFLKGYREKHSIKTEGDVAHLVVGNGDWVFPIPLKQSAGGWAFDPKAGNEEINDRRIGANELATIQSIMAYHDAQMEYAESDRDNDGSLEYAQKVMSTDGLHDGLFWADDDSGEISPLGPLFATVKPDDEWHGYRYRILTSQGSSAPGGAYDYMIGGNMSRGFAAIAWPADYGKSGVKTFMISQDGEVFEKDLGKNGNNVAATMKVFDPDSSWDEVTGDALTQQ